MPARSRPVGPKAILPGASLTYTCSHAIVAADGQSYLNTALATAENAGPVKATATSALSRPSAAATTPVAASSVLGAAKTLKPAKKAKAKVKGDEEGDEAREAGPGRDSVSRLHRMSGAARSHRLGGDSLGGRRRARWVVVAAGLLTATFSRQARPKRRRRQRQPRGGGEGTAVSVYRRPGAKRPVRDVPEPESPRRSLASSSSSTAEGLGSGLSTERGRTARPGGFATPGLAGLEPLSGRRLARGPLAHPVQGRSMSSAVSPPASGGR